MKNYYRGTAIKKTYSVLYGANGVKEGFKTKNKAAIFAQKKANSMKQKVLVDRITEYRTPKKPVRGYGGVIDWSQTTVRTVKPRRR